MSTQAYAYDFRGMNDATTPSRERIATFSPAYVGKHEHGRLWEAAPDMLEALEELAFRAERHGMNTDAARAAIAKATRKTA